MPAAAGAALPRGENAADRPGRGMSTVRRIKKENVYRIEQFLFLSHCVIILLRKYLRNIVNMFAIWYTS